MTATGPVPPKQISMGRAARTTVICIAALVVLLAPCWWQRRIMAGDLSSHVYNAWLATLIEKGQAPGLVLRPMITNVAFDIFLERPLKTFGPDLAQQSHIYVSANLRPWHVLIHRCRIA